MKNFKLLSCIFLFNSYLLLSQPYLDQLQHNIQGSNYWRLTRSVTHNKINRYLFSTQSASDWVRVQDILGGTTLNIAIRLTLDPGWSRIIYSDYNRFINSYGDNPGEIQFFNPKSICSSCRVITLREEPVYRYVIPLYVADTGNNRIVELTLDLTYIGPFEEWFAFIFYQRVFTGGGAYGELNYPTNVVYQKNENGSTVEDDFLWVTDTGNHRLVKIDLSDGEIIQAYGEYGSGVGQFVYPTYSGINGNTLYVVDSGNSRLVKIGLGQSPDWSNEKFFTGRYLYGIYADPFDGGVLATDGLNHALVRYDRYLREVFDYGTYGQGQSPGLLDSPRDIEGYYINRLSGSNNQTIYTDLLFVTEKWSDGSGQTSYFIQPKYITNSFISKGIWQAPGGGGGIIVDMPITGGQSSGADEYPQNWLGTYLRFSVSDICNLKAWIYNDQQSQLVRTIWGNNRLTMPGKVIINWNGKDDNGYTFWAPFVRLNIRVQSVYDPQRVINYSFRFNPAATGESVGGDSTANLTVEHIPKNFEVLANFPNPFNNTTHIKYQLPQRGKVELVIYNILGQKVRTLVDAAQEAGEHTARWDGRNDFGNEVGSGVYIYRIAYQSSDQNKEAVKKILLLK